MRSGDALKSGDAGIRERVFCRRIDWGHTTDESQDANRHRTRLDIPSFRSA